jgi:hypothetical protein
MKGKESVSVSIVMKGNNKIVDYQNLLCIKPLDLKWPIASLNWRINRSSPKPGVWGPNHA